MSSSTRHVRQWRSWLNNWMWPPRCGHEVAAVESTRKPKTIDAAPLHDTRAAFRTRIHICNCPSPPGMGARMRGLYRV